ncbi:MAG: alcohol dehydrogenase catalytic domain-containing protein [Acidobacteria bacterium]|nr:alcohol dehydrogenase catalytic domain-containing protein [Acidobacteriota bacterium]
MSTDRDQAGGLANERNDHSVSRRDVLKQGVAAAAGGAALLGTGATAFGQAPAVARGAQAGRRYRAFLTPPGGRPRGIETVILREIQAHQAVVRAEAAQACYTIVNLLAPPPPPAAPAAAAAPAAPPGAVLAGHGAVGIVEAVGSAVRRVQVGDRVIVPVTQNCGQCWNCLHGRGDFCSAGAGRNNAPIGDLADGTPVNFGLGGFAELLVSWEEQTVPVATDVPPVELSLLSCVMSTGLGLATKRMPVEPGMDVLVLGAGPLGLSAVQGARIQGANQIIVVEPVPYRRELAMKVGATTVLDPNAFPTMQALQQKIVGLCTPRITRSFAGARGPVAASGLGPYGPQFILEAVGGDRFPPKVPTGPDPTGVQTLQLAWAVCPTGGIIRTCGVGQPMGSTVTFPAGQWSNAGKTHLPGNFAGVNTFRDIPQFTRFVEKGLFDAKSLVGETFPLDRARDALQVAADRTSISGVVTFPS